MSKIVASKILRIVPFIVLGVIIGLLTLNYTRYIDLFTIQDNLSNNSATYNSDSISGKCPVTSCDTGTCCHATEYDPRIDNGVEAIAVLTYDYCQCPSDTEPTGVYDSVSTPGIIWQVCKCK